MTLQELIATLQEIDDASTVTEIQVEISAEGYTHYANLQYVQFVNGTLLLSALEEG